MTSDFVNQLRAMGHGHAGVNDPIQLQIHGVTTAMIQRLQAADYKNFSTDQLVQLKIHGVVE
ncbi:MAG TPA: hypothetical protein VMT86_01955 [Bryobacteraceae bacterium]|nr:hypothetical protein [Bryobacteraceae bacterium]